MKCKICGSENVRAMSKDYLTTRESLEPTVATMNVNRAGGDPYTKLVHAGFAMATLYGKMAARKSFSQAYHCSDCDRGWREWKDVRDWI